MINHPNRKKKTLIASIGGEQPFTAVTKPRAVRHNHEQQYPVLEMMVRATFDRNADTQLYTTMISGEALWRNFLDNLAGKKNRQIHNCNSCRRFVERYGGLAVIESGGMQKSAMWDAMSVPAYYRPALNMLSDLVKRAPITGPFYSSEKKWGEPKTGPWTHLSVIPYAGMLHKRKDISAEQLMASKRHDFETVERALDEWTPALLDEALRFLKSDALYRSDKFIKPAQWLRDLFDRPKGRYGDNVLWSAIAHAPDGFCHPRAGMLGTLIDDLIAGKSFTQIKRGFDTKMHGLAYQRPKMMSEGNVAAAEKLVEKLGIARSLERRFARLDELRKVWVPKESKPVPGRVGVFSHLTGSKLAKIELPMQTMTWVKFATKVLPEAEKITMIVPDHDDFIATVSAVHLDAPPILQWDHEDDRYPISQYRYSGGSSRRNWNLFVPGLVDVTAIVPLPGISGHFLCILKGCKDLHNRELALFPGTLKSELHGIRSTIEAHSKSGKLSGIEEASACGLQPIKQTLRVYADGAWSSYKIDRWD